MFTNEPWRPQWKWLRDQGAGLFGRQGAAGRAVLFLRAGLVWQPSTLRHNPDPAPHLSSRRCSVQTIVLTGWLHQSVLASGRWGDKKSGLEKSDHVGWGVATGFRTLWPGTSLPETLSTLTHHRTVVKIHRSFIPSPNKDHMPPRARAESRFETETFLSMRCASRCPLMYFIK